MTKAVLIADKRGLPFCFLIEVADQSVREVKNGGLGFRATQRGKLMLVPRSQLKTVAFSQCSDASHYWLFTDCWRNYRGPLKYAETQTKPRKDALSLFTLLTNHLIKTPAEIWPISCEHNWENGESGWSESKVFSPTHVPGIASQMKQLLACVIEKPSKRSASSHGGSRCWRTDLQCSNPFLLVILRII